MIRRREAIVQIGCGLLLPGMLAGQESKPPSAPGGPRGQVPRLDRPILFDSPEADRILEALQVFPPDNPWNLDISSWPVHPGSKAIIGSIGAAKPLRANSDMGFVLVPTDQPRIPVKITSYPDESDRGPFPVPDNLPIEGWPVVFQADPKLRNLTLDDVQRDKARLGGDRHAIVVDPAARMLYEFYQARKTDAGWQAAQTSIFDLKSNRLRPEGWTSTDAAGLPIFPSIVRHDEIARGRIDHALRVTVVRSRRAYVAPATHFASRNNDPNLPRMGERIRLKKEFDLARFSTAARTILEALKKHGMLVADNGLDWALSVAPDARIPSLHEEFRRVKGSDFEVVQAPK
jgi:hypothetical protein